MFIKRYISDIAFSAGFGRQMRFIAGPRQCGKTTIAVEKLKNTGCSGLYYNWDERKTKDMYRKQGDFLPAHPGNVKQWVCFDEIHKMPKWKNILKGFFDAHAEKDIFIVTGSARLDLFRKSGDSLAGRYFLFRINPLMLSEYSGLKAESIMAEKNPADLVEKMLSLKEEKSRFSDMMKFGPFPEPLIKGEQLFAAKWHDSYIERIIRDDIRDLTQVQGLEKVVDLVHMLPERVGSPLSLNSLREDLEINHATVKKYVSHLAAMYAVFLIPPYTRQISKPVKKEKKVYFYDYGFVNDEAARFENFTAMELLARVDLWNDAGSDKYALNFVRNRDGKETDFLITKNNTPYLLVEAKLNETKIDSHHITNSVNLGNIPFVQVTAKVNVYKKENNGIWTVSASRFFG